MRAMIAVFALLLSVNVAADVAVGIYFYQDVQEN